MKKKDDIRNRLFKVTSDFRKSQKEKPLPSMEQWEHKTADEHYSKSFEKREYVRKDVSVYGIFETAGSQFRASTKNVSMGGVLIDPDIHLDLDKYLFMTFFHRKFNVPVRADGRIVRVDPAGVGIQFNQTVPGMASV